MGSSGLRVSRLGLGTLTWGRETDGDEAAAQLRAFVDAGGTLVDTSPAYAEGASQRILAELLHDVVDRRDVVISGSAGIDITAPAGRRVDCSRRSLLAQLDLTLEEFGTDHLDLWQVAYWDPRTPVDEVAETLAYAVRSGRVRYAGVRGHQGWQLASAVYSAREAGGAVSATQGQYSLLERSIEEEVVPAALYHGVGVLAAVPLAQGILTGKYRDGVPADSRGAGEAAPADVKGYLDEDSKHVVNAVVTAADGLGVSPSAVALAWVRDRPGVAAAIVGARDTAQLNGSLASEDVLLPEAIATALDDVSA